MKTVASLMLACALLVPVDNAWSSPPALKGDSEWTNQHKSALKLTVEASGMVSGTFTTAVGCGAGKARKV
ncbi:MAG: avidin/streptavidin family protein, partial [Nitrospirota bacterium]|nr:avidin/streptavidin family protein [Nitrospirota bacterium]